MKSTRTGLKVAVGVGLIAAFTLTGGLAANANSSTQSKKMASGTLKAYNYINSQADSNNCGSFNTNASSTVKLASISNVTDFDPIGIGASAQIKGVNVSVSGNNGSSPAMTNTNKSAYSAPISGVACMSWSTIYLGVYTTAQTKVNGTLYSVTTHL